MSVAYVTDDLDLHPVGLPPSVAPAVLLLGFRGERGAERLVPGYLLTPAFYWRAYALVANAERKWEKDAAAEVEVRAAWAKWAPIEAWAREAYGEWLDEARPQQGHQFPPLPKPPDRREAYTPFGDKT